MRRSVIAILTGTILFWSTVFIAIRIYSITNYLGNLVQIVFITIFLLFLSSFVAGYLASYKGWLHGLIVGIQWLLIPCFVLLIAWSIFYLIGAEWTGGTLTDILNKVIIPVILGTIFGGIIGIIGGTMGEFFAKKR